MFQAIFGTFLHKNLFPVYLRSKLYCMFRILLVQSGNLRQPSEMPWKRILRKFLLQRDSNMEWNCP